MQLDDGNAKPGSAHSGDQRSSDEYSPVDISGTADKSRRFARASELITDAKKSSYQDRLHRERVYGVLQLVRLPLLVAAVAVYWVWGWWILALVLAVISIPLPGIAVVIANGKGEPVDKRERNIYKPAAYREAVAQAHLESAAGTALPDSGVTGPATLESTPHEIVDITESEPPAER
ncbi:hypothetical membrane protein [Corynebacterium renale]|uniref:DUF3099 domain-containing protein n=1 Tax=Corynebacterium renale TaxID=1724 RepID=UPI000DA33F4B|nr:DUF3099 domain-containing protein [Corynebacterium renale]SQG64829.1 hypothetical membrane protein [Corynebacterium renale]STC96385.1 hypothetical membrane protein [Corynebacterium renale]